MFSTCSIYRKNHLYISFLYPQTNTPSLSTECSVVVLLYVEDFLSNVGKFSFSMFQNFLTIVITNRLVYPTCSMYRTNHLYICFLFLTECSIIVCERYANAKFTQVCCGSWAGYLHVHSLLEIPNLCLPLIFFLSTFSSFPKPGWFESSVSCFVYLFGMYSFRRSWSHKSCKMTRKCFE